MTTRKWGGEFTVNTLTAGFQDQSAVTALADGGFMVAWRDQNPAVDEIKMQRYDALGNPVGGESLPFEDALVQPGADPDLVQLSDGNIWFVSDRDFGTDFDAQGQVVTLTGANVYSRPLSIDINANETSAAVASLGTNGAVGVYFSDAANGGDILMDIYDSTGAAVISDIIVNTAPGTFALLQASPDVAANAAGTRFAVVWRDQIVTYCRVFDNTGTEITAEFIVGTPTLNRNKLPQVAWLDNERFAVTFTELNAPPNLDVDSFGVYYAIYNSSGAIVGSQRIANTTTGGIQVNPAITALRDGGFAIAWTDYSQSGGDSSNGAIRLQVFDGLGNMKGGEILVNTTSLNDQFGVALATLADGRIIVTWTDGSIDGEVMAQIVDPRDGLVYGTANGDTLYGHATVNDEINGLDGADTIFSLGGNDQVHAGSGTDNVTLGRGDDVAYGGAGDDILIGGNGEDVLRGEGGEDTLNGGKGDDELLGGGGNDILIGGLGEDAFDGGADTDTADYSASTRAVVAALNGGFTNAGDALGDTFTAIENITGTGFNDTLRGTNGANVIIGGNGNDRIEALGGLDTLTGGLGNDIFFINNPNDGADTITDFSATPVTNDDRFELRGSNFGGLAAGGLLANQFQSSISPVAGTATVRFFHETDTGNLFWDRDGNAGAFGPVLIATLQIGATVAVGDFTII